MNIQLLWLLISPALSCPVYTCALDTDPLPGNKVYTFDSASNQYTMQACQYSYLTSDHPKNWGTEDGYCKDFPDIRRWASRTYQEYYEFILLGEYTICDPDSTSKLCDYNSNLECYFNSTMGSYACGKTLNSGDDCASSVAPCPYSHVCNLGRCVEMFTLSLGDEANNVKACPGGTELKKVEEKKVCDIAPASFGSIPKKCQSSDDCANYFTTDLTDCVCGINSEGQSYCQLFPGDDPYLKYYEAVKTRTFDDMVYWQFVSENYGYLQGSIPECLSNVWKDYGEYIKVDQNNAFLLGSAASAFILSLA
ncbi:unnamed protein product [Blepharisma stoltei]|uniref:Uncharacterized protein n=1 Tax=Blepharisma stoltei TaxID=1481888 RepID=A0AAU9JGV4_9CILI|nr:unnamed protein product [Blepharisma stoltei]